MRSLLTVAIATVLLSSCGKDERIVEVVREVEAKEQIQLPGYYLLEQGGELEILENHFGQLIVSTPDYPLSINPENGTLAVHPKIRSRALFLAGGGTLIFSRDVNYSSSFDVEEDLDGDNISGKKLTRYSVSLLEDGAIELRIEIFSGPLKGNPNFIIADRKLKGVRFE